MEHPIKNTPPISTTEREVDYLTEQVLKKHRHQKKEQGDETVDRRHIISDMLKEYEASPEAVLEKEEQIPGNEVEQITLNLSSEEHDAVMEELVGIAMSRGLHAAFRVVEKLENPHIADDFHRLLVEYVRHRSEGAELFRDTRELAVFDMSLYEVSFPSTGERGSDWKVLQRDMKRLLTTLLSFTGDTDEGERISLEIAVSPRHPHVLSYIAVPTRIGGELKTSLSDIFPDAQVLLSDDDYNVFVEDGVSLGARGRAAIHPALSLASDDTFSNDPFAEIYHAFTAAQKTGEGMSLQIVFRNPRQVYMKQYGTILDQLQDGKSLKAATQESSLFEEFGRIAKKLVAGAAEQKESSDGVHSDLVASVSEKMSATIVECSVRAIASAGTDIRAQELLDGIKNSFKQFDTDAGGGIVFEDIGGRESLELFRNYSYRSFDPDTFIPLNLSELSLMFRPTSPPEEK